VVIGAGLIAGARALIDWALDHSEAFAALAAPSFNDADPVLDEEGVILLIRRWPAKDKHHKNDIVSMKNFARSSCSEGSARNSKPETFEPHRIAARSATFWPRIELFQDPSSLLDRPAFCVQ
jgi:hypothetical protein